ncbi:pyruvate dehydrogenase (acetyl-transferring) E1 component subunit alpha [Oceanisphaera arctica]|uniref:Pyruvate dehydrogenase E1 component subunit alpha n=1 Tax=Oceanisphaera arctica TaxID=641510 RepID=A0A2P5TIG0_9GAMM|nr:pyruvate dehydrogenase (acetyl-transferring) E1 component subunit alpha [Oceanisphaera arctica]PPL14538.1 pyruvate dehydrogenase (acetyl-transferring) E1 component subunit alpha [Oceanisphaera arctica]GHA22598.1 pyruvate dehydrogenase E1 component subunit alpha [Oceanisphaera arctica]
MKSKQEPAGAEQETSHLLLLLQEMLRIRRFEERCAELYMEEKIRGFLHLYIGEEAVAVGVMQALTEEDAVIATYREHGHALARGLDMKAVMAEMYGKVTGSSRGRGGSMHIFDQAKRFYGGNAIVAGALPMAVGLALADQLQGRNRVTCCFFGEGAVAEGEFHESLNLAQLWQLPVLFVCENNRYAMGTALAISESEQRIFKKAESYGLAARAVDGMQVAEVEAVARAYCEAIRAGGGPRFLECLTYRFRGHSMFDTQLYRTPEEVEQWQGKGPIVQLRHHLEQSGGLDEARWQQLEQAVRLEINAAVAFAEQSEFEPESQLCRSVYREPQA